MGEKTDIARFKPIKLLPWQQKVEDAVTAGAKYIYVMAGRKSGKSELGMFRCVKESFNRPTIPDMTNVIMGPERTHVKRIFWRRLKHYIAPKGQWDQLLEKKPNETELYCDFKTGIQLRLEGAENETAIRGWNIGNFVLDEADETRASFFEEVLEPNMLIGNGGGLFIGTPKNRWFTKQHGLAMKGLLGRHVAAFKATPYDNPYVSKDALQKRKESVSREIWEQEYMANPTAFSGTKYHEFDNTQVVAHRNPRTTRLARFIDWGWDHPTVCLWAEIWLNKETNRWNIYVFNELSLRGQDIESVVTAIKAGDKRQYLFNVIDKSARRTEMGTGSSILNEFRKYGLPCIPSPKNDDYQVNALKMMLKNKDVQISENCRTLIKQLREVEWSKGNSNLFRQVDDATDAFKYGAGVVYDKDFTNVESMEFKEEAAREQYIDPQGLLAPREPATASWGHLGW